MTNCPKRPFSSSIGAGKKGVLLAVPALAVARVLLDFLRPRFRMSLPSALAADTVRAPFDQTHTCRALLSESTATAVATSVTASDCASQKRSDKGRSIYVPISCPATSNRNPETPSRSRSPDLYSRRGFWDNGLCEGGLHQDIQVGREREAAGRGLPCRRVWGLTNGL